MLFPIVFIIIILCTKISPNSMVLRIYGTPNLIFLCWLKRGSRNKNVWHARPAVGGAIENKVFFYGF